MDPPVASAASVHQDSGHAGGHASRLTFSKGGRSVLKRTSLEEAHVYCWLRALAEEGVTASVSTGALSPSCPLGCSDTTCPVLGLHANAALRVPPNEDAHSARLLLRWIPEARHICKTEGKTHQLSKQAALLELECLHSGLTDPFVIDIKMGTRLYGDRASPAKIQRATEYARVRGARDLGISFCGLWGREEGVEVKWEGGSRLKAGSFRPTTLEVYVELFRAFLVSGGYSAQVSRQLLQMLRELRQVWQKQNIFDLCGSSLLIVGGSKPPDNERVVRIKMIDFAHATLHPQVKDMGYLKGLDSLLHAVSQAAASIDQGAGSGGLRQLVDVWGSRSCCQ
ncbi:hypothetical protein Esti_001162 [Eimeria stiedai]